MALCGAEGFDCSIRVYMIKVVQFSMTALAGAPIRVAKAVNQIGGIHVRHVDLDRSKVFESDHVHKASPEETLALCEEADIIHLYNYVNYETKAFHPVDFRLLKKKGKCFVQHFQSTPMWVAEYLGVSVRDVIDYPIPKVVIAQYPERFLPNARVVPNIVPQDSPEYLPSGGIPAHDIVFSPSGNRGSWDLDYRWETKGMPETVRMLGRLKRDSGITYKIMHQCSLAEVMEAKSNAQIILDEMVTGSYHLSALEGLSLGKPVLSYLDARTDYVLRTISGSQQSPFINVRLEDAGTLLKALAHDEAAVASLGQASREWIDKYWRDVQLALHFKSLYEDLLRDPASIGRQRELSVESPGEKFLSVGMPDLIYQSRRSMAMKLAGLWRRYANFTINQFVSFIKQYMTIAVPILKKMFGKVRRAA